MMRNTVRIIQTSEPAPCVIWQNRTPGVDLSPAPPPTPALWRPVDNPGPLANKPNGGLWTSPEHPDSIPAWFDWCLTEMPDWALRGTWYRLYPEPSSIIYIDDEDDMWSLIKAYPRAPNQEPSPLGEMPDWHQVAEDCDAVWVTANGQAETRFPRAVGHMGLYGWDCETVWWSRWRFRKVELYAPKAVHDQKLGAGLEAGPGDLRGPTGGGAR